MIRVEIRTKSPISVHLSRIFAASRFLTPTRPQTDCQNSQASLEGERLAITATSVTLANLGAIERIDSLYDLPIWEPHLLAISQLYPCIHVFRCTPYMCWPRDQQDLSCARASVPRKYLSALPEICDPCSVARTLSIPCHVDCQKSSSDSSSVGQSRKSLPAIATTFAIPCTHTA
jgi:hypothetical protein